MECKKNEESHLSHEDLSSLDEHRGTGHVTSLLEAFKVQRLHLLITALHLHRMERPTWKSCPYATKRGFWVSHRFKKALLTLLIKVLPHLSHFLTAASRSLCSCWPPPAHGRGCPSLQRILCWWAPWGLPGWSGCRAEPCFSQAVRHGATQTLQEEELDKY